MRLSSPSTHSRDLHPSALERARSPSSADLEDAQLLRRMYEIDVMFVAALAGAVIAGVTVLCLWLAWRAPSRPPMQGMAPAAAAAPRAAARPMEPTQPVVTSLAAPSVSASEPSAPDRVAERAASRERASRSRDTASREPSAKSSRSRSRRSNDVRDARAPQATPAIATALAPARAPVAVPARASSEDARRTKRSSAPEPRKATTRSAARGR